MKRFAILFAAVAAVAVPFTAQAASKSSSSSTKSSSDKTVLEAAKADPQMSMWVDLVKKAGLDKTFSSSSKKVTVFVPDNDAFKKLSKTDLDKLTKNTKDLAGVLLYHAITGDVPASKLEKMTSAKTLEGSDVKLDDQGRDAARQSGEGRQGRHRRIQRQDRRDRRRPLAVQVTTGWAEPVPR